MNSIILQDFPYRTPLNLVDSIRDLLKDCKLVCDIGCGCGDILEYIRTTTNANVIGYELFESFVNLAKKSGRNYIHLADVTKIELPDADIFYMWTSYDLLNAIVKKLPPGKIVVCGISCLDKDLIKDNNLTLLEHRTYEYNETVWSKVKHPDWDYCGTRSIWIYKTN